jgi:hypothetical protein
MNNVPVVGDFGICFIEDDEYVMTSDGPRGSIGYWAPELRGRKIMSTTPLPLADIYSLGKVLYWIFTHEVYDGHQDEYSDLPERRLANLLPKFPKFPEFSFVDELIDGTIQRDPNKRSLNGYIDGERLEDRTEAAIERIEAGGRLLDLTKEMRCLFCANGRYEAVAMPPTLRSAWHHLTKVFFQAIDRTYGPRCSRKPSTRSVRLSPVGALMTRCS